jgi:hypothetical protein
VEEPPWRPVRWESPGTAFRPRRHRPTKLHADKAYDVAEPRRWLRQQGITPPIARKGIESSDDPRQALLGDRTQYRLAVRLPPADHPLRHAHLFCAFLTLAAVLTCYKKLAKAK